MLRPESVVELVSSRTPTRYVPAREGCLVRAATVRCALQEDETAAGGDGHGFGAARGTELAA